MQPAPQEAPRPILVYDGKIGDLYRIFLINLLLNIVTLGIWRFWGISRTRRYIWSRTSSLDSRFEYDGTGGQLFVGFLLAMLLVIGMIAAAFGVSFLLKDAPPLVRGSPIIVVYLLIFVLAAGAPFSAQRYRLSHTVWRGIRGGMQGSMITYGAVSILYAILMVLSFYQLFPWMSLRLLERRINASSFGTQRFAARGRARTLYVRFLLTFLGIAALAVLVFGIAFAIAWPVLQSIHTTPGQPPDPRMSRELFIILFPAYLVFGLGAALISAGYTALFFRHIAGHTTLGGLHFASNVTAKTVLWLIVGNALILVFTLGLGLPIVTQRNVRYFTENLLATGSLDLATLGQSQQPVSRFGEGMFQALDAGTGMG